MIRRTLFAGAAGAGLASALLRPAAAQQQQASLTPTLKDALGAMAFSLATSQLAAERADAGPVKTFAQLETEEQRAFTEARRMAGLPTPDPSMIDSQEQQMLQRLQGMRGSDFDRMYVEGQVKGHQELLRLHQDIAQSGSPQVERVLGTVAVPAIKSHLAILEGIQRTRT